MQRSDWIARAALARARLACAGLALLAGGCVSTSSSSAPSRPPPRADAPLAPHEARARLADQVLLLEQTSAPGEHHLRLRPLAGSWTVELEAFDAKGDSLGPQARGEAELGWILGGRFLRWESSLRFGEGSTARESRTFGLLGYAKDAQEYQLLMLSELVSGMVISRGRGDLEREGISLRPTSLEEPRAGSRRGVLRLAGPSAFVLEEHELGSDGREHLAQRATYRRRSAPSP